MTRFPAVILKLLDDFALNLYIPANRILDQIQGRQVAPAQSGSPGVVDLDQIPSPLTVREADGSPSVADVNTLEISGGAVTDQGGGVVRITVTDGGMANPMTAAGDLIVGGASGTPQRLAAGALAAVLTMAGTTPAWAPGPVDPVSMVDRLRGGAHSAELFTISTGINEFDLIWDGANWHLFYDDKTQTRHRSASTIAGLAGASDDLTQSGRYPTAYYDGATWHLWVYSPSGHTGQTAHYTASSASGPYSYVAELGYSQYGDVHVRRSDIDGRFYAGYKAFGVSKQPMGVLRADSPSGPWTDLGYVFADLGRAGWHSEEEADPAPFVYGGRAYVAFSGWDGVSSDAGQRVAIVEVDPLTWRALAPATVIVEPLEAWQQRGSQRKVFNPVFAPSTTPGLPPHLYYAHNISSAATAGWGYVEAGAPPNDGRARTAGLMLNPATGRDVATGVGATAHGSGAWGLAGLVTTGSTGGAYGWTGAGALGDFTLTVEFTPSSLPASGQYALIARVGGLNSGVQPLIAMWVKGAGAVIEAQIQGATTNLVLTGATALSANTRYHLTLRRLGSAVTLLINGAGDASGTNADALSGLREWALCNQKGQSQAAGQQLAATIHRAELVAEALPLDRLWLPLLYTQSGTGGTSDPALGGDLSGTASAAVVEAVQGQPWASGAPSVGDVATWDGAQWAPAAATGGEILTDDDGAILIDDEGNVLYA